MPNPYGNIAGVSDVSEPGWQQRLLEAATAGVESNVRSQRGRRAKIYAEADTGFVVALTQAARARNISVTGYIRRSVAAFLAHDLGVPIGDLLAMAPKAYPFGVRSRITPGQHQTDADCEGGGTWEVR